MIGIFQDSFLDYLKQYVSYVKVTSKNIVIPCLWCGEYQKKQKHSINEVAQKNVAQKNKNTVNKGGKKINYLDK